MLAPVPERPESVGRQERGPGEGRLRAQGAVQLDRVTARLVDLEGELIAREDDAGAHVARARLGGEEGHRFLGDSRSLADEILAEDELPPARVLVTRAGVRIGATLHLVVADRLGLDPAARLHEHLLDRRAFRGGEVLGLPPDLAGGAGGAEALHGAHRVVGAKEKIDALAHRNGERIDRQGCTVRGLDRRHRRQAHVTRLDQGGRPSDRHGLRGHPVHLRRGEHRGSGKAPGAVGDGANAHARRVVPGEPVEVAVADVGLLDLAMDEAGVGVGRPADARRLEGPSGQVASEAKHRLAARESSMPLALPSRRAGRLGDRHQPRPKAVG